MNNHGTQVIKGNERNERKLIVIIINLPSGHEPHILRVYLRGLTVPLENNQNFCHPRQ